ncbi:MAG: efflux RND transporter permease subunit [Bacteroidota bacterium]|nr:efflux RND transporter permease subunit [Bacteroidota bacterium]MDE2833110.1 efflux RND transporter permease subunit [Bacteroidota bacterium]
MKNAIAYMARNSVAANLLMLLILLLGVLSVTGIPQEVFQEASLDTIEIRTEYAGASPEEVVDGVVRRIEEAIEGVDGIDRISSTAAENVGIVTASLKLGADVDKALDEIKSGVDRIITFPAEAERPVVRELTNRRNVLQIAIYGETSERTLKVLAERMKDDLTQLDDISYVRLTGARDYEIAIEVSEHTLAAYGLRLSDVAAAVRRGSLDLPGGKLETHDEEILIRSTGRNYTARDFEDIIVLASPAGASIRLADIATVTDGFTDGDLSARFEGQPAVLVSVSRTGDERVLDIAEAVDEYLTGFRATVPDGISIDTWRNEHLFLESRLNLLIKNGIAGFVLVTVALILFMNVHLALWTVLGLLLSIVGSFTVMAMLGVSIDMTSLFAFIVAIGIVVDDAIVVGENIYREQENGLPPLRAAIQGATRLCVPVTFAVLTTIAAFSPMLFVPGSMGKLMRSIPTVAITVLVFSLIESLFILPAHLSHMKRNPNPGRVIRWLERLQSATTRALQRFVQGPLDAALRYATRRYGLVLMVSAVTIVVSLAVVRGGLVNFIFIPEIEGEVVSARIEMPLGTTADRTQQVLDRVEVAGRRAAATLQAQLPDDHPPLVTKTLSIVGDQPSLGLFPMAANQEVIVQQHLGEISFELVNAEIRRLPALRFEEEWRQEVGELPEVSSLVIQSALLSLGSSIRAEISAPTVAALEDAVTRFRAELAEVAGVSNIDDDRTTGKREVQLELLPEARTLGLTFEDMAQQVRSAFFGTEAVRVQRGRDDIRVMVRLPEQERNTLADLQRLQIRTAAGARVPLSEVATASFGTGPSSIARRDRRRVVTVMADVDEDRNTLTNVVSRLETEVIPAMQVAIPGMRVSFEGELQQQAEAVSALARGFIIALFIMYALLAIPFRSYSQPFIIMAVIPFGFVGALIGHIVMGLSLSMLSLFGIVALSGVVINDSLVMIDFINERTRAGVSIQQAIWEGGKARFRPILLTSITTFLGVLPLILERSTQAQFLIPMAVSLGVGVLFATVILMMLVPALMMLHFRLGRLMRPAEAD